MTIAAQEGDILSATIVPHTWRNTTLAGYRPGDRVNLECNILAKYVAKAPGKAGKEPLTVERLRENGY